MVPARSVQQIKAHGQKIVEKLRRKYDLNISRSLQNLKKGRTSPWNRCEFSESSSLLELEELIVKNMVNAGETFLSELTDRVQENKFNYEELEKIIVFSYNQNPIEKG